MSVEDRYRNAYSEEQLELFPPERPNYRAFQVALVAIVVAIATLGLIGLVWPITG